MSRIIKNYGYVKEFNDEIIAETGSLTKLPLPDVRFLVSKNFNESYILFAAKIKECEDKHTVTIVLKYDEDWKLRTKHNEITEKVNNCPELMSCTASIDIDEIEFCDAVFAEIIKKNTVDNSPVIRSWVLRCANNLTQQMFDKGYWIKTKRGWINHL